MKDLFEKQEMESPLFIIETITSTNCSNCFANILFFLVKPSILNFKKIKIVKILSLYLQKIKM